MRFRETFTKPIKWSFRKDEYTFVSNDFNGLLEKVSTFYSKEDVNVIKQEIIEYICQANPTQCIWENKAPNFNKTVEVATPPLSVFYTVAKRLKRIDDKDVFQNRCNMCSRCPHNTQKSEHLKRHVFKPKFIIPKNIGICNKFNLDIGIAAQLEYKRNDNTDKTKCWL